jgi:hypothetical protein
MKFSVSVKPNARETAVVQTGERALSVRVHAPPREGKANDEVIRAVAEFLGVPASRVTLVSGARGKRKVLDIA